MSFSIPCRLCRKNLSTDPSFQLDNIPLGVQFFPKKDELVRDKPVRLNIYCCKSCGLVQAIGNQVIYEGENSAATSVSPKMMQHKNDQAKHFITKYKLSGKKFLEAGCGDGHFLKMLIESGAASAIGVEPSVHSKISSPFKNEVTIHTGYISEDLLLSEGPFDAFATFHVMEHLPNIHDFVKGLYNNLKVGAVGFVEVPSSELITEQYRFYDIINDHLNYFTLSTLQLAFQMNQFDIVESYKDWNGEHDCLVVRKQEGKFFDKLLEAKSKTIRNLNSIMNTFGDKRVAIWGASMHATTLLSQIKTNKIKYVVDSAFYKQGRYMPVNHYPIVHPIELKSDPVDCVIVVAPRFVDEIVDSLLEGEHQFKGRVAVLENDNVVIKN
jgi:cyclopropane fatty-acyl-phospholipid synthase-like methyltransferase